MDSKTWIASFDIGKKNFAFCVEEVDVSELHAYENIPVKFRYNADGTPSPDMKVLLSKICKNGKIITFLNSDLTDGCAPGKYLDPETFHNMTDLLDSYQKYWDKCSVFVIEQQMDFGKMKRNSMALKLGQHCYSYFCFQYGRFRTIIDFPAFHKTQVMGAPKIPGKGKRWKSMSKPHRKKWSVEFAKEILLARGDDENMKELTGKKKRDDLADVLVQLQAFKYLCYVEKSI